MKAEAEKSQLNLESRTQLSPLGLIVSILERRSMAHRRFLCMVWPIMQDEHVGS